MCNQVEQTMSAKADKVFLMMSRDYLSVIGGEQLPQGQTMPKWERKMRSDVAQAIEDRENTTAEAEEADEAAEENDTAVNKVGESAEENSGSEAVVNEETGNGLGVSSAAAGAQEGLDTRGGETPAPQVNDGPAAEWRRCRRWR
jgi:hypothetical protein